MPRLLLRLLAGVHLVAFVSLWVQIDGLIGSRGILPARDFFTYLDWQMWLAVLDPAGAGWLGSFVERLFEGEPAVPGLLGEASRQAKPPRHVRLRLYDYRFSDPGTGAEWWRREFLYDLGSVAR
ncbi:MAG: lipase maturation factor family protein [Acidobacteria bacterium]|nr:lipase maturation factor family protein [Acidobacteriota bacterium]